MSQAEIISIIFPTADKIRQQLSDRGFFPAELESILAFMLSAKHQNTPTRTTIGILALEYITDPKNKKHQLTITRPTS